MEYWPFWIGGGALAAVMIVHWLTSHRLMAVSGAVSSLVDAVRNRREAPAMSEAELIRAAQEATRAEFGDDAVSDPKETVDGVAPGPRASHTHLVFFASLVVGGAVSSLFDGSFSVVPALRSSMFERLFGASGTAWSVLLVGGILVGFGTRMASGCSTGHGLCGVSRFQPGSLLATAAFFGAGIVVALILRGLA